MKLFSLIALFVTQLSFAHTINYYPGAPFEIITIGHPTLTMVAEEVNFEDIETEKFQQFADDMIQKMGEARGVGLAAPQVNVSKRMFVMKPSAFKKAEVIINPIIEYLEEKGTKLSREGCLSIPGKGFKVTRYKQIHLNYTDRHGEQHAEKMKGFRAIVAQHEYDHLNGVMISDFFNTDFFFTKDEAKEIPLM